MQIDLEKLIEDMHQALKNEADLSVWKNDRKTSPVLNFINSLHSMPKTKLPTPDLMRVKNQVLDRIAVPAPEISPAGSYFAGFARFFKVGAIIMASLVVFVGTASGVAAAALNSIPGQAFYPLKKVVENLELRLASSDNQKAALQIRFADNRVDELQTVLAQSQAGQLTDQETQKIITRTVQDLQKTAQAAAHGAATQPKVVSKLADLTDKLQSASIQSEGQVKIEIEKAVQNTRISQEQAIANLQKAGIKLENSAIILDNVMHASGKLTAVSETSVSIGSAKFLINKDTVYTNIEAGKLAVDQAVDIEAEIKDNKTYARKINLIADTKTDKDETDTPEDTQEAK